MPTTTLLHAINKRTVRKNSNSLKPHKNMLFVCLFFSYGAGTCLEGFVCVVIWQTVKIQYPESKAALPMNKYEIEYNISNFVQNIKTPFWKDIDKILLESYR